MSIELTDKQSLAWAHLQSEQRILHLLYGGGKGGGKSFLECLWVCNAAKELAVLFNLPISDDPIPVGFFGRKRACDFYNTTLSTWKRTIPQHHWRIKEQKKQIIIDNRVAVQFGGLDNEEDVNKFNSAEFAFAAIDQAEEVAQSDISVLSGSLRLKVNGIEPKYRLVYSANPAECWLKSEFDVTNGFSERTRIIEGIPVKYVYVPALYTDNSHLPENYTATLEMAFGYDEALLAAYKTGDWSLARDSDFVVTRTMLNKLVGHNLMHTEDILTAGLDPSIGGDECVMYALRNGVKFAENVSRETNTMIIASDFMKFCRENGVPDYGAGIDTCGLGIGIGQRCHQLGFNCSFIQSAESATDSRCQTVRDEVWLTLREKVERREIGAITDDNIIKQITAFRFKTVSNKFRVMPKAGIKSLIGCSPDRGDAFAYAVYMMKRCKSEQNSRISAYSAPKQSYDWRAA